MPDADYSFEIEFLERVRKHEPEDLAVLELLAGYYTKMGQVDEGLVVDQKVVELDPDNPISHYNLACSLALKHRSGEAVAALEIALSQGYDDISWMLKDPDLIPLHNNPQFIALVAKHQKSE